MHCFLESTQTVESGDPGVWPWSPTKSFVPKAFAGRKRWELSKSHSSTILKWLSLGGVEVYLVFLIYKEHQRTISWCSICLAWGDSRGVVKQNLAKWWTLQVRFWPHDLQNRVPDAGGWHPWTTAVCLCGTSHGAASQGPDALGSKTIWYMCDEDTKTNEFDLMFFFLFDGRISKGMSPETATILTWDETQHNDVKDLEKRTT